MSMLRCTASGNKNPIQMGSKVVALRHLSLVLQLDLDYASMYVYLCICKGIFIELSARAAVA